MLVVDWIVVSGLPTPNATRVPTSDTPQSVTTLATSPSTRPLPTHHCAPVAPVVVVRTQNEIVKLSCTERGSWTDWFVPLRLIARPVWPATNVGLFASVPLNASPLPSLALFSSAYDATRSLPPAGGTRAKMPVSMYWPPVVWRQCTARRLLPLLITALRPAVFSVVIP